MSIFVIFLIGLCIGSFLNVAIDRPFQKRSIISGRSSCDFCHHTLSWFDLIPVLSFIFLMGKCRYCHKKLSWQYPLVELTTGIIYSLVFAYYPHATINEYIVLLSLFMIAGAAIVLFVVDLKHQILPDTALVFLGIGALLFSFFSHGDSFLFRLLIGIVAALPFFLISFFSAGRAMGFGDVKLTFILGFFLSFPSIVIALYSAFLTGAAAAIILILEKKKKFHGGTIAFGPFLLLGAVIAFIWGNTLWGFMKILLGF